ncbi:hypothetical protein [Enterococcus sp. AZ180]|uniref:hypothetical protein n=1 Tax=Enterococcus sp. AZ180 TaxID=2774961 RepID=UPI003F28839F
MGTITFYVAASLWINILRFIVGIAAAYLMIRFVLVIIEKAPKLSKGEESIPKFLGIVFMFFACLGLIYGAIQFDQLGQAFGNLTNNVTHKTVDEVNKGVNNGGTPGQ